MSNYHHFTSLHSLHSPFLLPLTTILSWSPFVYYIIAPMGQASGRLAFVGRRHCQLQFGIQIAERVLENRYSVPIPWQKPYNNRRINHQGNRFLVDKRYNKTATHIKTKRKLFSIACIRHILRWKRPGQNEWSFVTSAFTSARAGGGRAQIARETIFDFSQRVENDENVRRYFEKTVIA